MANRQLLGTGQPCNQRKAIRMWLRVFELVTPPSVDIKPKTLPPTCLSYIQSMVFFMTPDIVPWYSEIEEKGITRLKEALEFFDVRMSQHPSSPTSGSGFCQVPETTPPLWLQPSPMRRLHSIPDFDEERYSPARPNILMLSSPMGFQSSTALECRDSSHGQEKQCLCMHRGWSQTGDGMSGAEDEIHDVSDEVADGVDDIALASVKDALDAVENEEQQVESTPEESPSTTPRNVIPELEDVEDPEEMVEVLLTVGEERSRRNDVKGALAAFNKAIALDPSCDMAWFNRGVLLEAQQDARGARQSFQICLDLNEDHAPATANLAILLERIGDLEGAYETAEKALGFFPGHPALVQLKERCKNSGISVAMEAMQPSIEVTQEVDMQMVEEIAEEAGIEDPEMLLQEAVHHDHDEDQTSR